jgi:fructosamine-3-kinase
VVFGHERDNWIGRLAQPNAARRTWPRFYAEQRLVPQMRRARDAGHLDGALLARSERLLEEVDALAGPAEPPARLHGDLWTGNVLADSAGRPVLVDPAVYGGHREMDLAMMRLFGGFTADCFAAYQAAAPLTEGHEARIPLWQLYPLLVHLNLFGAAYRDPFARTLAACERR